MEFDLSHEAYLATETARSNAWVGLFSRADSLRSGGGRAETPREILHQPWTWMQSAQIIAGNWELLQDLKEAGDFICFTGAGSSVLAGHCIDLAVKGRLGKLARAVATTDLIVNSSDYFLPGSRGLMVSFSRSGGSPESFEAIRAVRRDFPDVQHLLITCNTEGDLIRAFSSEKGFHAIALHPATCDRGLAMTSSFTGMVLCAQALLFQEAGRYLEHVGKAARLGRFVLQLAADLVARVGAGPVPRVCLLGTRTLRGAAGEGALKILEMTDGRVCTLAESYLGIRHGPLSFLDDETLVIYLVSSDPLARKYECDLIREVRIKDLGAQTVAIGYGLEADLSGLVDNFIELSLGGGVIEDDLRPVIDVLVPQVVSLALSLAQGLDPDNPSPRGVIRRVAGGFQIYPAP